MKIKMLQVGLACVLTSTSAVASAHHERALGPPLAGRNCQSPPMRPNLNWSGCDKAGANLQGAVLVNAVMQNTNLQGANLKGANLSGANLTGAKLKDAKLGGATVSPETIWKSGKPCTGFKVASCPK